MKNKVYKLLLLFILFNISYNVKAVCNDSKLNEWAENVEIIYQVEEETEEYKPKFSYVLLNSSYNDQVVMKAIDSYSSDYYVVGYATHYKTNAIGSYIHFDDKTYKIEFYGSEDSLCPNELLRTIEYTVPSLNTNIYTEFCNDEKYKDSEICELNPKTKLTNEEFSKKVEEILENESQNSFFNKSIKYISNYWYYIIIPFILAFIVYSVKVYLFKKEQSHK